MTLKTTVSSEEFELRFSENVGKKATPENAFYGKANDGIIVLKNAERSDSVIKGTYSEDENGNCCVEYIHTKPTSDKVFWFIYMAITGFFTLALLKDYPVYSLVAFVLLVFGIICFMIRPRRFEKQMAAALADIAEGKKPAPVTVKQKEEKTADETLGTEEKTDETEAEKIKEEYKPEKED